jgi:hypothetical protein
MVCRFRVLSRTLFSLVLLASLLTHPVAGAETSREPKPAGGLVSTGQPDLRDLPEGLTTLSWSLTQQAGTPIGWGEVIQRTQQHNVEIAISQEKITETEVKRQDVETKRVLFFFKYFDSAFLEGSAESDVMAAGAHAQAVLNQSLLDSLTRYTQLMRAAMAQVITYQSIQQGKTQLTLNQRRFTAGETTSFDLMQTKTQLVQRYQEFLQAGVGYKTASYALAEQLGLAPDTLFFPQDLTVSPEAGIQLPVYHFFGEPPRLSAAESVRLALENRPEFKELKFRRISLENLLKASTVKFDRVHEKIIASSLKQLDLRRQKLEGSVRALTLKAYDDFQFADQKLALAGQQLAIAQKALKQVQVSHQSGFSSNKDVLDAQVAVTQAQVNQANALIDYNLSQVQLLYETGLISPDTLQKGKIEL